MLKIAKNFNGYIVFIVVMNFREHFSIAKIFPSRFPGIFANIFQHKIIPIYSMPCTETEPLRHCGDVATFLRMKKCVPS